MKIFTTVCLSILCFFLAALNKPVSGQTIELLAGNTLNGAVTGLALGGATMGLQNSADSRAPLRVGLGLGTLYGIGVGVYDVTKADKTTEYYVSATFNDGKNSSVIVLLDTFYGATAGAVVATAITLIINEPVVTGLQYGASIGAWGGFGFGLIDAFTLAKGPSELGISGTVSSRADGFFTYQSASENLGVGLLNPSLMNYTDISGSHIQQKTGFNLEIFNIHLRL